MLDHSLDEFSNYIHASPVTSMNDDITFAAILRELFCEVVNEVALLDGRTEWQNSNILEARAYSFVSYTFSCSSIINQ